MSEEPTDSNPGLVVGRYALHGELASGGMATVHLGRLLGPVGFSRAVAIKRLHEQYAKDPQFVAMFLDEARLAARVRHQNVVPTLDVVSTSGELFLVMDYVHGESLSRLLAALSGKAERVPPDVACAIAINLLEGLHAAHEAKDEKGEPLAIVHRDVSPQNVLVGTDGVARVFDFGVAKAAGRMQTTQDGSLKGKMAYMAPEQLTNDAVDRRTDVWAAAVVLWEMLAGTRLFFADSAGALVNTVMTTVVAPPSTLSNCPRDLDDIVLKGLAKDKSARFQTAREMAVALENALRPASPRAIGEWLEAVAGAALLDRAKRVEEMESAAGIPRPSRGTLSARLAALGLESSRDVGGGSAEEPTAVPRGRVGSGRQSSPPSPDAPGASAQFNAMSVVGVGSTTRPPPGAHTRSRWVLGAFAIGIVTALASGVVWVRSQRAAGSPTPIATASPSATATATVTATATTTATATATASPSPSATATATATVTATATAAAGLPPRATAKATKPPASASAKAPKPDCDPPYTIGPAPDFIKKPKLECLPQ